MKSSIYDTPIFFESYLKQRANPISLNEIVEKPMMFSLIPDLNGKRVLDLGCGTGEHLAHYLAQGARFVAGVDLSQAMLAKAEQNLNQKRFEASRFHLFPLSMENLSALPEENFDVITSSFAFHYVENFAELLKMIKQKLAPNGLLIFSQEHPITTSHFIGDRWEKDDKKQQVAYRLNHYRLEGERLRNWFKQPFKTYHRTLATILNQLILTGFSLERVEEPMLSDQPEWHDEFKDLLHRPPLLFLKARLNSTV